MLVLSRRLNEKILFPSMNIAVQVVSVKPGVVRLGIDAPPEITVLREEVPDRAKEWGQPDSSPAPDSVEARLRKQNRILRHQLKSGCADLRLLRRQLQLGFVEDAQVTLDKIQKDFYQVAKQ